MYKSVRTRCWLKNWTLELYTTYAATQCPKSKCASQMAEYDHNAPSMYVELLAFRHSCSLNESTQWIFTETTRTYVGVRKISRLPSRSLDKPTLANASKLFNLQSVDERTQRANIGIVILKWSCQGAWTRRRLIDWNTKSQSKVLKWRSFLF